jgi:hypothetical protein
MAGSLDVVMPHALGKQMAVRRLQNALDQARARYGNVVTFSETEWADGRLVFSAKAMSQSLNGVVDVDDAQAKLHVDLPLVLRPFAAKLEAFLLRKGAVTLAPTA